MRARVGLLPAALCAAVALTAGLGGGSSALAHKDARSGPTGHYKVVLREVQILLQRASPHPADTVQPDQARIDANRQELEQLQKLRLFVRTKVTVATHGSQTAIEGLYPVNFDGSVDRPYDLSPRDTIKLDRTVYTHDDCAPAEPLTVDAQGVLVHPKRLPKRIRSLLKDDRQGVVINHDPHDPSSAHPDDARIGNALGKAMNPAAGDGVKLPGVDGPLDPNHMFAGERVTQDLTGQHFNFHLVPHSTTTGLFVHYVFEYDYLTGPDSCGAGTATYGSNLLADAKSLIGGIGADVAYWIAGVNQGLTRAHRAQAGGVIATGVAPGDGIVTQIKVKGHAISGDRPGPGGSEPIRFSVARPQPDGQLKVITTTDPPFTLPGNDGVWTFDMSQVRFKCCTVKKGDIVSLDARGGEFAVFGQVPGSVTDVFTMAGPTQDPGYMWTGTPHQDVELLMQVTEQLR